MTGGGGGATDRKVAGQYFWRGRRRSDSGSGADRRCHFKTAVYSTTSSELQE